MNVLLSKIPSAVVFANFFLYALVALPCTLPVYAQVLSSFHSLVLPDASGITLAAPFSSQANPALLAALDSSALVVAVAPSRFGLSELSQGDILYAHSTQTVTYAGMVRGIGNSLYNELSATGFFALAPSPTFDAGIAIELDRLGIRNYPTQTAFQLHLGMRLHLTPSLSSGIALHNLTRAHWIGGDNTVEQTALFSLGSQLSSDIAAAASILVQLNHASSFILTVSHDVLSTVHLRLGVQTYPRSAEGTVLWYIGNTAFIGTLLYHDELGISQRIGCLYQW